MFDFRPVMIDGAYHLSLVAPRDSEWQVFSDGAAIVLNASYQPVHILTSTDLGHKVDLHEFNILDDGRTALIASNGLRELTPADNVDFGGKAADNFFTEVDLLTQKQQFNWTASDHVDFLESTNRLPKPGDVHPNWDWLSVEATI